MITLSLFNSMVYLYFKWMGYVNHTYTYMSFIKSKVAISNKISKTKLSKPIRKFTELDRRLMSI